MTAGKARGKMGMVFSGARWALPARFLNVFLILLIGLNVLAVILGSEEKVYDAHKALFDGFELFSIIVFTLEYIIRHIRCVEDDRFRHPFFGRLKYALTPLSLVDLLSFLPFYIPFLIPLDLRFLRIIRLFRVFRIFKLVHHSRALALIWEVLKLRKNELLLTYFLAGVILILSSCFMFYAEHDRQSEAFRDIPAAMWWCLLTLSTIGSGSVFPVTILGKTIGAFLAFMGVGLFALPAGILASGFVEAGRKPENTRRKK